MTLQKLIEVNHLKKWFQTNNNLFFSKEKEYVKAVNDVSFYIDEGETLGLVGESGCGKSTTGRILLRLIEATEGEVLFNGVNIYNLSNAQMKSYRKDMQIVFQDPFASLNPKMKVKNILLEPLDLHTKLSKSEKKQRLAELMEDVGLDPSYLDRYPHEFSGGQRQRIGIARALAVRPKLIIMDEPVSALDVSVQAQVINLVQDLQKKYNLTYLFITHNLSVVRHISNRIAVMYLGEIVELADSETFFENPLHPYSKILLSAIPIPNPEARKDYVEVEEIQMEESKGIGCLFSNRCSFVMEQCKLQSPVLDEIESNHLVRCHLYNN